MTNQQQSTNAVLFEALQNLVRSRPYGTIRALERGLGRRVSWWQKRVASGDIKTQDLLDCLAFLGVDAASFVREHAGDGELELDKPRGQPPRLVRRAKAQLSEGASGGGVGEAFLDRLDERCYFQPDQALALVEETIEMTSVAELPRLLGTAGAAHRVRIELDAAEHCFHAALESAWSMGDHRTAGNLLRRFSYVQADNGRFSRALRFAERATAILVREGDAVGVGKGAVEQGLWLYCLERYDEAIKSFEAALEMLPEEEGRYRFSAFQTMGLVFNQLKETERACGCFDRALRYLDVVSARHRAKLLWLRAGIKIAQGELAAAESELEEVISILRLNHHGDTALATCDLVGLLLRMGKPDRAFSKALSMRALVEPLRHNPVVSAAIAELLRAGSRGLTLALVEAVRSQIESERQRRRQWYQLRAS